MKIRAARQSDIVEFHGHALPHGARAWVAEDDGKIVAVAGYYITGPKMVWSEIKDEMRDYPVSIFRFARFLMGQLPPGLWACLASKNEAGSERLLQRLGWTHARSTESGEVYLWARQ